MSEAAARNRSEEDLQMLEEIIKKHKEHINEDYEFFAKLDYDFHQQVVKCSGNDMCFKLMETLNILMKKQMVEIIYNLPVEDRKLTVSLHERVYESIRDKKPEQAREAMQEHMERPYRFYKNK
jgi:GntR family transcriptional repressor for pyruvate dehydrogenase complex